MADRIFVGQVWADRARGYEGRTVTVTWTDAPSFCDTGFATCKSSNGRTTRIAFETLRRRFVLVPAAESGAQEGGKP